MRPWETVSLSMLRPEENDGGDRVTERRHRRQDKILPCSCTPAGISFSSAMCGFRAARRQDKFPLVRGGGERGYGRRAAAAAVVQGHCDQP